MASAVTLLLTRLSPSAKSAKGHILIEIDADVIIPNKDIFFTKILNTFKDDKVIAAMPKLKIYPEERQLKDAFFHFLMNGCIRLANNFGSFLSKGECQIMRKAAFEKVNGYNENIVVGEDCDLFHRLAKSRLGKINYFSDLEIYQSPRRFREEGYLKLFLKDYLINGIWMLFTGKSRNKEWQPFR